MILWELISCIMVYIKKVNIMFLKSKFNYKILVNILLTFLCSFLLFAFLLRFLYRNNLSKLELKDILIFCLMIFFITIPLYVFKNFGKIKIENNTYIYIKSLLYPFGKTIYFKDFKGIYKTTETGSSGTYDVVYLVDHYDITRFKIMGLYYKNMNEIIQAIPLPVIKKNLSPKEYIKLMFTGRANLSKIKDKKNVDDKIAFYFKIFIAIIFTIFIIGMIIRIFSKL